VREVKNSALTGTEGTQLASLLSPSQVSSLLARYAIRPKRRLGQNFLIDRNILNKIVDAAQPAESRYVLEIGPGLGTATIALAEAAEKVVAVEADPRLIPVLQETLRDRNNVEIVQADFLKLDLGRFLDEWFDGNRCVAVSNLPYYITSPIITRLIEHKDRFLRIVLMVQKEVAARLAAKPGLEDYGALTVLVQYHCRLEIIAQVSRNVFYPPPDVDSALILLEPLPEPSVKTVDEALFFRVVRAAFGKRRKTIWNALTAFRGEAWSRETVRSVLRAAGIDPRRRGETLSLEEFARVADSFHMLAGHNQ